MHTGSFLWGFFKIKFLWQVVGFWIVFSPPSCGSLKDKDASNLTWFCKIKKLLFLLFKLLWQVIGFCIRHGPPPWGSFTYKEAYNLSWFLQNCKIANGKFCIEVIYESTPLPFIIKFLWQVVGFCIRHSPPPWGSLKDKDANNCAWFYKIEELQTGNFTLRLYI